MKRTGPHFKIIRLVQNAALLGPVLMQCENKILEGHEQSSRRYGGLSSRARCVEMNGNANRNLQRLSRHKPSRIKELQHNFSIEMAGAQDSSPAAAQMNFTDRLLTEAVWCSMFQFLTNSLGNRYPIL